MLGWFVALAVHLSVCDPIWPEKYQNDAWEKIQRIELNKMDSEVVKRRLRQENTAQDQGVSPEKQEEVLRSTYQDAGLSGFTKSLGEAELLDKHINDLVLARGAHLEAAPEAIPGAPGGTKPMFANPAILQSSVQNAMLFTRGLLGNTQQFVNDFVQQPNLLFDLPETQEQHYHHHNHHSHHPLSSDDQSDNMATVEFLELRTPGRELAALRPPKMIDAPDTNPSGVQPVQESGLSNVSAVLLFNLVPLVLRSMLATLTEPTPTAHSA